MAFKEVLGFQNPGAGRIIFHFPKFLAQFRQHLRPNLDPSHQQAEFMECPCQTAAGSDSWWTCRWWNWDWSFTSFRLYSVLQHAKKTKFRPSAVTRAKGSSKVICFSHLSDSAQEFAMSPTQQLVQLYMLKRCPDRQIVANPSPWTTTKAGTAERISRHLMPPKWPWSWHTGPCPEPCCRSLHRIPWCPAPSWPSAKQRSKKRGICRRGSCREHGPSWSQFFPACSWSSLLFGDQKPDWWECR